MDYQIIEGNPVEVEENLNKWKAKYNLCVEKMSAFETASDSTWVVVLVSRHPKPGPAQPHQKASQSHNTAKGVYATTPEFMDCKICKEKTWHSISQATQGGWNYRITTCMSCKHTEEKTLEKGDG